MLWKGYFWLAFALCIDIALCRTKIGPNNVNGKDSPEKTNKQLKHEQILQSKAYEGNSRHRKPSFDGSLASNILNRQSDKSSEESPVSKEDHSQQQTTNMNKLKEVPFAESYSKSRLSGQSTDSLDRSHIEKHSDHHAVKSTEETNAPMTTQPRLSILEEGVKSFVSKAAEAAADVFIDSLTGSKVKSKDPKPSKSTSIKKPKEERDLDSPMKDTVEVSASFSKKKEIRPSTKKSVTLKKAKEDRKVSKSPTVEAMRSIVEDEDEDDAEDTTDKQGSGSGGGGSGGFSFKWLIGDMWARALRQSRYEQEVEDLNALQKVDDSMVRRLIVMPLTDSFKPHQADMMHGKIQYGDRCSLPASLGKLIFENRYEVPWLFEVVPVRKINSKFAPERLQRGIIPLRNNSHLEGTNISQPLLNKAYMSPLDFRSPENYIFLPQWLMTDLGLQANDLVDISMVRIKLAELVVVQPVSLDWDTLIEQHGDPKSLLEHELSRYSSLTSKSTIAININGKEYPFYVKDTKAEGGVSVKGVRVQDADIRTDIDRSVLDKMVEAKKAKNTKQSAAKSTSSVE